MNARIAAVLAVPALLSTAHAAPPAAPPRPLVASDQAGDANAVNNQGIHEVDVPSGTVTPVSLAQYDLRSLTIAPTGSIATRKAGRRTVRYFRCTGFTATVELAGPPQSLATMYRVEANRAPHHGGNGMFWLEHKHLPHEEPVTDLRFYKDPAVPTSPQVYVPLRTPARIEGTKITFTVTAADLAQAGERLGALRLTQLGADVRGYEAKVASPLWDQLVAGPSAVWAVCPA